MSEDDSDIGTANTMRDRADESGLKLWLLLGANRTAVTAVLAVTVFLSFLAASVLLRPSLSSALRTADTVETLFTTMIGVVVTGTTLVVTISQLVISQENGPLGDQRERMSGALDFRSYTSELIGGTVPADPSTFLRSIVAESEERADALEAAVADADDAELAAQTRSFVDSLRGNARTVADQLEDTQFGTFDVLFAALDYNYGWKIYQIDRLTDEFEASIDEELAERFEALRTAQTMFGPAREHIKTLYFQWALINLSQYILYAAVPALVVAGCMATFVGPKTFLGTTLGIPNVTWVVAGAFTVTVVPFLLFTAYILRIATAAKRTLAIGPLILRESQR